MRNWKNWLAPILTCLTVLTMALLPSRLSALRDRELTGAVHAEELAEDSNFPAKSPELPRRLQLLAQHEELPDSLTFIGRELEGEALAEAAGQARAELASLAEAGVLPEELVANHDITLFGSLIYLRDQADLSSAAFINLGGYDNHSGEYRSLVLDRETGLLVWLELDSAWIKKTPLNPADIGAAFLDRLGLAYQPGSTSDAGDYAAFLLPDTPVVYSVNRYRYTLHIRPRLDWKALDASGASVKTRTVSTAASTADVSAFDGG